MAALAHAAATESTHTGGRKATLIKPGVTSAKNLKGGSIKSSSTPDPYSLFTLGGNRPKSDPP